MDQKGDAGRAAGEQSAVAEHHHAKSDKQRAGDEGLHIFIRPVLQ